MSACTFFGHRDCPEFIYPQLVYFIRELVLKNNVRHFYVGTQGNFDNLAYRALKELQDTFQEVIVFRVLAYKPRGNSIPDSMLPEGIEAIPPKYAIPWRNRWMISRSDYVTTTRCSIALSILVLNLEKMARGSLRRLLGLLYGIILGLLTPKNNLTIVSGG